MGSNGRDIDRGPIPAYGGWVYHVGTSTLGYQFCRPRFLVIKGTYVTMFKRDPVEYPRAVSLIIFPCLKPASIRVCLLVCLCLQPSEAPSKLCFFFAFFFYGSRALRIILEIHAESRSGTKENAAISLSRSLALSAASLNEEPPGLNSFAGRMHGEFVLFCEIRAESRSGMKNAGTNLSLSLSVSLCVSLGGSLHHLLIMKMCWVNFVCWQNAVRICSFL